MNGNQYSDDVAMDILNNEGIGYATQHYASPDSFASPRTRELWAAAREALAALEDHLAESTGRVPE